MRRRIRTFKEAYSIPMNAMLISYHVDAPRTKVYRALLDAHAVAKWMAPAGMKSHVHAFDAREGGGFRISYGTPAGLGKRAAHTGTYHGRFLKLRANRQLV